MAKIVSVKKTELVDLFTTMGQKVTSKASPARLLGKIKKLPEIAADCDTDQLSKSQKKLLKALLKAVKKDRVEEIEIDSDLEPKKETGTKETPDKKKKKAAEPAKAKEPKKGRLFYAGQVIKSVMNGDKLPAKPTAAMADKVGELLGGDVNQTVSLAVLRSSLQTLNGFLSE